MGTFLLRPWNKSTGSFHLYAFRKKIRKKGRGCKLKERVQIGAKRKTVVHRVFLLLFNKLLKDDFSTVIS